MSTPERDDEGGALPRLSPRGWVLSIAGVLALVAVVAWYGLAAADEPVRWKDVGFSVASPTEITVTYEVYLYDEQDAICHIQALNTKYTEVGITERRVSRADGVEQRITTTVATTEEATAGQVDYCEPVAAS